MRIPPVLQIPFKVVNPLDFLYLPSLPGGYIAGNCEGFWLVD